MDKEKLYRLVCKNQLVTRVQLQSITHLPRRKAANMAPAPEEEDLDLMTLHNLPTLDCILDISSFLDCGEYTIICARARVECLAFR